MYYQGGFAKCYQATELESQEEVAIKIITKENLIKNRAKQKVIVLSNFSSYPK